MHARIVACPSPQVRRKYHVRPGVSHILALLGGLCAGQDPSPVIHLGVSTSATRPSAMAALAAIHSAMLQEAGQHPDWPGSAFVRANRDAIAAGAKRCGLRGARWALGAPVAASRALTATRFHGGLIMLAVQELVAIRQVQLANEE